MRIVSAVGATSSPLRDGLLRNEDRAVRIAAGKAGRLDWADALALPASATTQGVFAGGSGSDYFILNGDDDLVETFGGNDMGLLDKGAIFLAEASFTGIGGLDPTLAWSTHENPLVADSSIPHALTVIQVTPGALIEEQGINVTSGQRIIFDIDFGGDMTGGQHDLVVQVRDTDNNVYIISDNASRDLGGYGSGTDLDPYIDLITFGSGSLIFTISNADGSAFDAGDEIYFNISVVGKSTGIAAEPVGNDTMLGGDGNDQIFGVAGNDSLVGGNDDDTIVGGSGTDILLGGDGDDLIEGGAGSDSLDGGAGSGDIVAYALSTGPIGVNLATGASGGADAAGDTISGFEGVHGSRFGDVIVGSSGDNFLDGRAGNDTILGDDGNDTIKGGLGSDSLDGGAGLADVLTYESSAAGMTVDLGAGTASDGDTLSGFEIVIGTDFDDVLVGSNGSDTLVGGSGNDVLSAGGSAIGGTDSISGGDGNDTLIGSSTAHRADGGDGTDFYEAKHLGAFGYSINLATGGTNLANESIVNFENVDTHLGNDTVIGTAGANVVNTNEGDDFVSAGGGADTIDGGSGNDTIRGGAGSDSLAGGAGSADWVDYQDSDVGVIVNLALGTGIGGFADGDMLSGFEAVFGSGLADVLIGSSGNDTLHGLAGDDVFSGGNGSGSTDVIEGGAGNDTLIGSLTVHQVDGGDGIDFYEAKQYGTNGYGINLANGYTTVAGERLLNFENVDTGAGDDSIIGSADANVINANEGDDFIVGEGGNDTLRGADGNDTILGGAGGDSLDGGTGVDTLDYSTSADGVFVSLTDGTVSGGDAQGDVVAGFEVVIGSAFDDWFVGSAANDTLRAGAGNDILMGSAGSDSLDGGAGWDEVDYRFAAAAVVADLESPAGNSGEAAGDVYISIENLSGSDFDDLLAGDGGDNTLSGGGGNDTIIGRGGNDFVNAEVGNDVLSGGAGSDTLLGADGDDVLFGGSGADTLHGFRDDDRLNGGAGADALFGGEGNDVLVDKIGGDTLGGGIGDDTYVVRTSTSVIEEAAGEGVDTVQAKADFALADNVENLNLRGARDFDGTGNGLANEIRGNVGANLLDGGDGDDFLAGRAGSDTLEGGAGNDTLRGDRGADSLNGGTGDDVLFGDEGIDTLTGGAGADSFVFLDDSQFDTITDFEIGTDTIRLSDYRQDNGGARLTFSQLLITQDGADTVFRLDLDRNGIADSIDLDGDGFEDGWSITLLGITATDVTAADFVF